MKKNNNFRLISRLICRQSKEINSKRHEEVINATKTKVADLV